MYVDVAVDFSDKDRMRTYTYAVPRGISVGPGDLVWVPFGYRPVQGIALSILDSTKTENVRDIDSVVEGGPFISERLLRTAIWIADYYRTTIFRACVAMLPPGANQQLHIWVSRGEVPAEEGGLLSGNAISSEQRNVLGELPKKGRVRRDRFVRKIGRSNERHLDALVRQGTAIEESIWERPRASAVFKPHARIAADSLDIGDVIDNYVHRRAHRRAELVRHLVNVADPVPRAELSRKFGSQAVKAVIDDGVAVVEQVRVERDPLADYAVQDSIRHELTLEQQNAVETINSSITESKNDARDRRFLLFGVTGSGKTEVYLRAVEKCIEIGRRAIVMVPEIAMTPQTLQRFASRFPGRIALQHSGLTMGQRFDQWHQVKEGRYDVVIGSRSSIFAPVDNLGLVVIDEEHEWTFKQSDRAPRYNSKQVAERLCDEAGATLLLGSATPDIATFHRVASDRGSGDITMLRLSRRINETIGVSQPRTDETEIASGHAKSLIVDMRVEIQEGHREMLSRPLLQALSDNVEGGGKSILFINRRGSASFVQCMLCGTIRTCPNCQTPLTLHRNPRRGEGSRLQCHYCSYSVGAARQCRKCGGYGDRQTRRGNRRR